MILRQSSYCGAPDWQAAADRMIGREILLPSQWKYQHRPHLGGEQRLMVAVLTQAIDENHTKWIEADDITEPCSYLNVCAALGIDPYWFREGLRRRGPQRKRIRRQVFNPPSNLRKMGAKHNRETRTWRQRRLSVTKLSSHSGEEANNGDGVNADMLQTGGRDGSNLSRSGNRSTAGEAVREDVAGMCHSISGVNGSLASKDEHVREISEN